MFFLSPKRILANGSEYTACEGAILLYHPSRGIVASNTSTYEIVFTDEYGQHQDLKDLTSYTVRDYPDAHYAMPYWANADNKTTTYSNGTPLHSGNVVLWGEQGKAGRARWDGPGKWEPVPCAQGV